MIRGTLTGARRGLCRVAIAACVALGAFVLAGGASARPSSVTVGRAPVMPAARVLGAVSPHRRLKLTVVLNPTDAAALSRFAAAVTTPGNPDFRHFLNVSQFAARFGASASSIAAVRSVLRADGLSVGATARNRLSIDVSGDAAHVARAFGVRLRRYRVNGGREIFSNDSAPRLPGSLEGIVANVLGLDDLPASRPAGLVTSNAQQPSAHAADFSGGQGPAPCPDASAYASGAGEYTINQVAAAYGYNGLYAAGDYGQGVTVALYELEGYPNEVSDIGTYQDCFGTSTQILTAPLVDGGPLSNVSAETSVDLENLIGLAPKAKIVVYEGPNNYPGNYDTLRAIVDSSPEPQVINDSWAVCEPDQFSGLAANENTLLQQAAVQGASFFTSSGDRGSQGCVPKCDATCAAWTPALNGPLEVDDPASQPYATAVGGSDLSQIGPPVVETAWNELYWGGSGGGLSTTWAMQSYQSASGVPGVINSYSSGAPCGQTHIFCREVPDVSADSAPHQGYTIFWNGRWTAAGGTSTSAPVWAALAALADAAGPSVSPYCSGAKLGFLNPLLYEIAAGSGHATALRDLTVGDNNPTFTGPYSATAGYDMMSGLGTPIATAGSSPGLVAQLCRAATPTYVYDNTPPSITSLSAPEASVGDQVTITGSGFTPFSAVWFGGVFADTVSYVDPQHLVATVPPGGGNVGIEVIKYAGTSSPSPFTYAPTETLTVPAPGGAYTQGQSLTAAYSCAASTAGTPGCSGTLPVGAAIDTSALGIHQFSVTATDANNFHTTSTASYTIVAPPAIALATPSQGALYGQGQVLGANFACSTSAPVRISSCAAPVLDGAAIDTQTLGLHTFTVAATDSNGVATTRTVTYTVVAPPRATISKPADGAAFVRGASVAAEFACVASAPATLVSCASDAAAGGRIDTSSVGPHRLVATATDSTGTSASTSAGYTVVGVKPQISRLRQASSRWLLRGAKHTRLPVGTTFSFTLDQSAVVTLHFSRHAGGRRRGSRCVVASSAPSSARRCTLDVGAGTFAVNGQRGSNAISFTGRTSSGRLRAGTYTVTLTAVGLSGTPSAPVSLRFTVSATA